MLSFDPDFSNLFDTTDENLNRIIRILPVFLHRKISCVHYNFNEGKNI